MPDTTETPVVTVFLRHRGDVLLLRRSDEVGSYAGQWGAVAGHVDDGDPEASAIQEIHDETGLSASEVMQVRRGEPFAVDDEARETRWRVHPYLFDAATRAVETNWETAEAEWAPPTAMLERDVVPQLWTSYRRVAPSVLSIANDTTHGSATLSLRALAVLRDRAGMLATAPHIDEDQARAQVVSTARRLLEARPSMAALRNRVSRVMRDWTASDAPVDALVEAAHTAIGAAVEADAQAAARAAAQIAGRRVLTLSRSGTVVDALQEADPAPTAIVATSDPGGEGRGVAEALDESGLDVTLVPDAAVATAVAEGAEAVLVGADTVLPSGSVVNKTGTRGAALAAAHEDVPFYAACAVDKISPAGDVHAEEAPAAEVYDGRADLAVRNPRFDVTPASLISGGLVTERGVLSADEVKAVADELAGLADWA